MYACPDFVRRPGNGVREITFGGGTVSEGQRAFNYTRAPWCRRPTFGTDDTVLGFDGAILAASKIYAPSLAVLLVDEAWYANVGRGRACDPGNYRACDPVWDVSSSLGIYHGASIPGEACFKIPTERVESGVAVKQANVAAYDGHVELYRDPCPLVDSNHVRLTIKILKASQALQQMISGAVYSLVGEKFALTL